MWPTYCFSINIRLLKSYLRGVMAFRSHVKAARRSLLRLINTEYLRLFIKILALPRKIYLPRLIIKWNISRFDDYLTLRICVNGDASGGPILTRNTLLNGYSRYIGIVRLYALIGLVFTSLTAVLLSVDLVYVANRPLRALGINRESANAGFIISWEVG